MSKKTMGLFLLLFFPYTSWAMTNEQIVNSWASAAQGRNGKEQFNLLCKDQQDKVRSDLESTHWVTGVSSPGIGKFKTSKINETTYQVKYLIVLQDKPVGTVTDEISVQNGCIDKYKYLSPTEGEPGKEPF